MSTTSQPSLSVVVVTYEWPDALDVALSALSEQRDSNFEIIVADDGSGTDTANVVDRWRETYRDRLVHVWQPDEGWRKSRVLNLGALAAKGDYLVFLDGDVVPRRSFVRAIRRAAMPGWFLASKRARLSEAFTRRVLEQQLHIWRWSTARWLFRERREVRRPGYLAPLRDRRRPWRPNLPDFRPPDRAHGFFLGVSRADFERANGWDMRFTGWACEDSDLAVRLLRIGLRCGWPGPAATLFHLWHLGPVDHKNEQMLFETMASDRFEAVSGLRELAAEQAGTR